MAAYSTRLTSTQKEQVLMQRDVYSTNKYEYTAFFLFPDVAKDVRQKGVAYFYRH